MSGEKRAAVAIIRNGEESLLIRRKLFPGDPWAGHVAFPGGHVHDNETIEQGLLREVKEEVDLDLLEWQIKERLGPLHPYRAPGLTVYPIVIDTDDLSGARSGPEVEDIKVVNLRDYIEKPNPENGFPAMDYGGWIVWGLTYRIIKNYLNGVK